MILLVCFVSVSLIANVYGGKCAVGRVATIAVKSMVLHNTYSTAYLLMVPDRQIAPTNDLAINRIPIDLFSLTAGYNLVVAFMQAY